MPNGACEKGEIMLTDFTLLFGRKKVFYLKCHDDNKHETPAEPRREGAALQYCVSLTKGGRVDEWLTISIEELQPNKKAIKQRRPARIEKPNKKHSLSDDDRIVIRNNS